MLEIDLPMYFLIFFSFQDQKLVKHKQKIVDLGPKSSKNPILVL